MSVNLTSFDAALKQHYTTDEVENMVYKDNPLLALMAKMEDFGGRNLPIPTIFGNPQGRSVSFTQAQSRGAATSSKLSAFLLTRTKDYSVATIDNETLEASKGNANAFLEAATLEIDGAINTLTRSIATKMYRDGSGAIGQVGSVSGATLTLLNPDDVVNFEVGMCLDVAAAETSGSTRTYGTSGNPLIITGIDRNTGVLTFGFNVTDSANGVPGTTANDYLFVTGDRNGAISGLEAWCPATAPSSTLFFGVDRTQDLTRLGGQRLNAVGAPIEEAVIDGASQVARDGGRSSHALISFKKYAQLEKALGSKVQYVDLEVNAEVGFRGIVINGPKGPIKVIPDQNCPTNRIWLLQLDTWKLYSLGKAVRVIDTDGLQMLRQASSDGVEVRYGFYGNIGCRAPGWNINIQI